MSEPEIAAKQPITVTLEPGSYWWCACGRSKNQPFCDGSHAGTAFEPTEITVTSRGEYYLCACKRTKTPPYCDGSHENL
ncbi:MAG: CDGSH iron-sulfur domain-containing protein [Chromatiales bacterium]|nr:CDGSH iron-sulfur domain-containing protein [Chromatiales bacterium]